MTLPAGPAAPRQTELRWRRVFPGDERAIGALRHWLASLLPECAARDDVVAVSVELATNAVKFASSAHGGWFAVEITWHGQTVRVAVADGGGPTVPHVVDDPMGDHGRGLVMVRALARRTGVSGDERGRLVWAEVPWTGDGAVALLSSPDAFETAIRQDEAALSRRFAGVAIWFGRRTLQWWALPGNRLLTAPSAGELAESLDHMLRFAPRLPRGAVNDPGAARAGGQAHGSVAPVPPRIHRGMPRIPSLGVQPC